jgi:glycosyltransferase 2 family protein
MNRLLKRLLPIGLSIGLLAYALKDISFSDIGQQFEQAKYGWIGLVVILIILSYILRGKRWQQALLALGHQPTTFRATVAMQSGLVASMIVPGSGELTRCATIGRTDGVPLSHAVGSVVAERVLDLIMLGLLLLLAFVLELSRMQAYLASLTFVKPGLFVGVFLAVILLGGIGIYFIWQLPSVRNQPLVAKIRGFSRGLGEGFLAIRRLPNPTLFVVLTLLGQFVGWLSTYILLLALDSTQSLPPTAALTIMTVASIGGLAVPTQGGIGTYHFFVSRALVLYGLTLEEGVVAATFMHAVGLGTNLLLSSISFMIVPFLVSQRQKATESVRES